MAAIIAKPFPQTPCSIVRPHVGGLKVRESWPVDRFVAMKLEWPPVGRQYRILIDVVDRYRMLQSSPRPMKMIPCSLNCVHQIHASLRMNLVTYMITLFRAPYK